MTLFEIRRRIDALKRRFARELAIIKLRRVAEAVANDWNPRRTRREPSAIIRRIVNGGFRLPTFVRLSPLPRRTPDAKAKSPTANPWFSPCCPGPTATATGNCSAGTFRLSPPAPRCCGFRPATQKARPGNRGWFDEAILL